LGGGRRPMATRGQPMIEECLARHLTGF
jgi:hypothetical protein